MISVLIADDEPALVRSLQAQLAAWPDLQVVATARNGLEAAEAITRLQPDVAFLDIQMPGMTGLEVAQGIEGLTRVVFVTAFDAYAVEAFEQEAVDYVLKPTHAERLGRTVQRVRRSLAAPEDSSANLLGALQRLLPATTRAPALLKWVRASRGDTTVQVSVDEVLYFQADEKYTVVQTGQAELLIRTPICDLIGQLEPQRFWQIHRSTIVNMDCVEGTRRDELSRLFVRLRGSARELPVSRAYVHLFKAM